ncbi:MAG: HlyC/CorC family transporter [Bacteroidales bacterium]|nr:HlyC/CorC family transporter [Bacteroidales bacterium]
MEILIIVLFVLLNGFFSMSEIAVVSSRKTKLDVQAKNGSKNARSILSVIENPDKFLSTIQICITTIGLIIGLYTGESYVNRLSCLFAQLNIDPALATIISRIAIVVVETFFMLIFGELLPKRIGMSNPEKVASLIIRPMRFLARLFAPFVWFLSKTTGGLSRLFGIKPVSNQKVTEDEIKSIIDDSADAGEIALTEQDIVTRVFDLDDRRVESLMTPRKDLQWVEKDEYLKDLIRRVDREEIHYIYPVCDKSLDNIVGVMFIKDMFPITPKTIDYKVKDIMREPNFIHESISIYNLLETFKQTKIHYAFIIDEFGLVQGMITMNDILEALVGNSSELETNPNEQEFLAREDGSYLIDGQYPFYDFLSHFDLEDEYQKYAYNTISGLILAITGKVPKTGDRVNWRNFIFEIMDMDGVRIDKVLVIENKETKEKND